MSVADPEPIDGSFPNKTHDTTSVWGVFMSLSTYNRIDDMLRCKRSLASQAMDRRRWEDDVDLLAAALRFKINNFVFTSLRTWQTYSEEVARSCLLRKCYSI
ncbi:unnamed protein product [Anisakis simplex]|uniref:Uncharacterized protein n=1 Tax=Anisakis simplex TaxID=6269 RepID=A0A0M3J893_ANISI|nr:unnamed protein product [Anisakis simplex]